MENAFTLTDSVSSPVVELCPWVSNQQRHEGLFVILEIHFLNTSSQKQSIVWLSVCVGRGKINTILSVFLYFPREGTAVEEWIFCLFYLSVKSRKAPKVKGTCLPLALTYTKSPE